jgi:hypothetical protein
MKMAVNWCRKVRIQHKQIFDNSLHLEDEAHHVEARLSQRRHGHANGDDGDDVDLDEGRLLEAEQK